MDLPNEIVIPAPSKKEAMDWSLVLVSQGIESRIDLSPEGQWSLAVDPAAEDAALDVLAKYSADNRRWAWQQQFSGERFIFDWGALAWLTIVAVFFVASESSGAFKGQGVMSVGAVSGGEWWRLFTAIWLHADAGHLAANATIGVALMGLVMGLYGTGNGLLLAALAGVGGNLIEWILMEPSRQSLGASGVVMGCIGLLSSHVLTHLTQAGMLPRIGASPGMVPDAGQGGQGTASPNMARSSRPGGYFSQLRSRLAPLFTSLLAGVLLFVLLGLGPETDVVAHAGGFVSGVVLGMAAALIGLPRQGVVVNLLSGLAFLIIVMIPWLMAFR